MRMYQHSKLSRRTFEEEWRVRFMTLFQHSGEEDGAPWLPNQVFSHTAEIAVYHPQPYFLRRDYRGIERALRRLGENEFVVLDRGALKEESEHVGIVFQQHTNQFDDAGQYHIEGQPLDFYMFGRCPDWGFVSSEPYNIGVLNAKRTVLEYFIAECPGTDEEQIREYLEHVPTLYQSRFERNYLMR